MKEVDDVDKNEKARRRGEPISLLLDKTGIKGNKSISDFPPTQHTKNVMLWKNTEYTHVGGEEKDHNSLPGMSGGSPGRTLKSLELKTIIPIPFHSQLVLPKCICH